MLKKSLLLEGNEMYKKSYFKKHEYELSDLAQTGDEKHDR